jgi:PAS domain S-box-containing protein
MGNLAADLDNRLRALEHEFEQLAADRQRYAELFSHAPEAFLVTDLHGTILEANQAADALLEGRGALRGRTIDAFVKMEQRRMFQALVGAMIEGVGHGRLPAKLRLDHCDATVDVSLRRLRNGRIAWSLRCRG